MPDGDGAAKGRRETLWEDLISVLSHPDSVDWIGERIGEADEAAVRRALTEAASTLVTRMSRQLWTDPSLATWLLDSALAVGDTARTDGSLVALAARPDVAHLGNEVVSRVVGDELVIVVTAIASRSGVRAEGCRSVLPVVGSTVVVCLAGRLERRAHFARVIREFREAERQAMIASTRRPPDDSDGSTARGRLSPPTSPTGGQRPSWGTPPVGAAPQPKERRSPPPLGWLFQPLRTRPVIKLLVLVAVLAALAGLLVERVGVP